MLEIKIDRKNGTALVNVQSTGRELTGEILYAVHTIYSAMENNDKICADGFRLSMQTAINDRDFWNQTMPAGVTTIYSQQRKGG